MLDPITSNAASKAVASTFPGLARKLGSVFTQLSGKVIDQTVVAFRSGFQHYLETSHQKCRVFKTIINTQEPLEVMKYYVNVTLSCGRKQVSDTQLINELENYGSVIVSGLAGSGKSMFMKYLTVWLFENDRNVTPLFFELRHLNALTEKDILSVIRNACASRLHTITENQFHLALGAGAFILILDGFDEVNHDVRNEVQRQILKIRKDFPRTVIVVSGRPDDRFSSWTAFHTFRVNDFNREQTVLLIRTLPYDDEVKRRFIKKVEESLYQQHQSFLSSPLLTTIMLLTFESFASIPVKIHAFYGQAFDTLFLKHDAQKDQFVRKTHTGLELEEFKDCFAAFCAISYAQEQFSFQPDALEAVAKSALDYFGQTRKKVTTSKKSRITPAELIRDLQDSFCMLQNDGVELSFVHRSFQEYFAARFVTKLESGKIRLIMDKFSARSYDALIPMLFDMFREPMEMEWVLPTVLALQKEFFASRQTLGETLAKIYDSVSIRCRDNLSATIEMVAFKQETFARLQAICTLYPSLGRDFIVRHLNFPNARNLKLLLKDENRDKPSFKAFEALKQKKGSKMTTQEIAFKDISASDSWWLEAFGQQQMIDALELGLNVIAQDIQARAKRRNNILADLMLK